MKKLIMIIALLVANSAIGQNVWVQKTSASFDRYGAVGFSIGTKGYVGTGYNSLNQPQNDLWEWDQTSDSWSQKASMVNTRSAASVFVIDGFAYVGLGYSPPTFRLDLQRYDPVSNTWIARTSLPAPGRYGSASFAASGKGYIACGNLGTASGPFSNQLWEYDPILDSWTAKAVFPGIAKYGTRGGAIDNKGYVVGGGTASAPTPEFWQYDPSLDTWTSKADFPSLGRGYPSVFVLDGKLVVGCGNHLSNVYNDFFAYDPLTNIWAALPSIPSAATRWASVAFEIGGLGYNATGYLSTNTATGELWELTESNPVIYADGNGGNLGCNPDASTIDDALGNASASGGCSSPIIVNVTTDPPVSLGNCIESVTRTFTATDDCGISADPVSVTVTYKVDFDGPVIVPTKSNDDLGCNPSASVIEDALGAANATDNCDASVIVNVSTGAPVNVSGCAWTITRTFTASDSCGNPASSESVTVSYSVDNAPVVTCNGSGNITVCDGTSVNLNPSATDDCDGNLPVDCTRSDGLSINDPFSAGITTVTCTATDACGNTGTCSITVTVSCNDDDTRFCTYSQGGYGTPDGAHCNGAPTNSFLLGLLSNPLIIGGGSNTLTITDADVISGCFFTRLPGGGPAKKLNGTATCSNPVGIALNGTKFKNVLLNQTITLGLNLRIPGSTLADLQLTGTSLITYSASASPCASSNSTPVGTSQMYALPAAVINYLGVNNTVSDLYDLANQALAGTYTGSFPSLSQIATAVDNINNAFIECRVLGTVMSTTSRLNNGFGSNLEHISMSAYPNPFSGVATINFMLNGFESDVVIDLYSLTGQKIATLYNDHAEADMPYDIQIDGNSLIPGVYIYYLRTEKVVYREKMTLIK